MPNSVTVGRITGSPLCGLCERICIRVKQITDGCIGKLRNYAAENVSLTLIGNVVPVAPFEFVSAENFTEPVLRNLAVTVIEGNRIRVSYDAEYTMTVTFTDSYNRNFYASGIVTIPRNFILRAPADGRYYSVEITGKFLGRIGTISDGFVANFTGCVAIITAIVVNADVIVPSYGECIYPDCNDFSDRTCEEIFRTPPFN